MYMQVDVPMERVPVANWVVIGATVFLSIAGWVGERKAMRANAGEFVREFEPDAALQKQLADPRIPDSKRDELYEEAERKFYERNPPPAPAAGPFDRYALHTDREDFRVVQLVGHMFLHVDLIHLIGNMLFLFCFGNAVNAKLGHATFLALYFVLGILAGVGWLLLGRGPAVGASGAIMGITGAFLVLYPLNEMAIWTVRSLMYTGDAWRFPSWVVIAFYMAFDLVGTMALMHQGIAYVAHLAGECAGVAIVSTMVLAGWVRSERGEQNLMELWGWAPEPPAPKRRKRRRPPPPPPPVVRI